MAAPAAATKKYQWKLGFTCGGCVDQINNIMNKVCGTLHFLCCPSWTIKIDILCRGDSITANWKTAKRSKLRSRCKTRH